MSLLATLSLIAGIWLISVALYRVFFSSLARFPGPKLAALTSLYELYYECFPLGQFTFHIQHLHDVYGPIVRIGPNELHIDDPEYFNVLYSNSLPLDKDPWFYRFLSENYSAFAATEHSVHRQRRSKEEPLFSKAMVNKLEPTIMKFVDTLFSKMQDLGEHGEAVNLTNAYKSLTADIITDYCFLEPYNLLLEPDFARVYHKTMEQFGRLVPLMRHISFLRGMIQSLPERLVRALNPNVLGVILTAKHSKKQIMDVMDGKDRLDSKPHPTIARELLNSDLPASEKTFDGIKHKIQTIIFAGIATVTRNLEVATFELLSHSEMAQKLKAELAALNIPRSEMISLRVLEKLPYLTAVITETLRITGRLPRVNRNSAMSYNEWIIPKDTSVSMSLTDVLRSEQIYEDAKVFNPSRWLDPEQRKQLQRYFVPFGRGNRACLGTNLAWAELYLIIGNLFHRFDMALHQTTAADLEPKHCIFGSLVDKNSNGLNVEIIKPA